jgi:hypothetical protein
MQNEQGGAQNEATGRWKNLFATSSFLVEQWKRMIKSMLQTFVPNVLSVFSNVRCKLFIWMLHMFHIYVSVLSECCVCFCNGLKCF